MREPRHWPTQCLTNLLFTENALVQAVPASPILHLGWHGYARPTAQSVYCPSNSILLWATYFAPPHVEPFKMGPVRSLPSSDPAGSKEKKAAPTSGSGGRVPNLLQSFLTPSTVHCTCSLTPFPFQSGKRMTRMLPPSSAGSSTFFPPPQNTGLIAPLPKPSPKCQAQQSPDSSVSREVGHRHGWSKRKAAGADNKGIGVGGSGGCHMYLFIYYGPLMSLSPAVIPPNPSCTHVD